MQEQERIANEEAEKRLKAALAAKRESGTAAASASRVATPDEATAVKPESTEGAIEDAAMEVDSTSSQPPQVLEVSFFRLLPTRTTYTVVESMAPRAFRAL